ncbi:hypothetical protein NDA11_001828 [Ustilago hordei]|uniref:Reverse transcriptase Ty1/copia-type domain-containing protein n=1 Tax=Ustilago hordei TaxID=120017 RepID=I2G687_USTHO|nr:hypothetical protein NDA10_001420 [Ustilago hordei]KAJ1586259.1 hypothetical protein NDA12_006307 [Ustilago hordei]KAJ1589572.1 hypothetical protein NDA15_006639 [Ustilago hordei]KAJ1590700.1 hypothetical protein NDA11_001828 [Ustilago hordei]KAJ1600688.1 hypothetical protein NDA14_002750 [Ustilago hordei]
MTKPSKEHYNAAQKVLQYLDHMQDIHLQYGGDKQQDFLTVHSDMNWASDTTVQRRSSSSSAVFVHGNLVAWKSALQHCTSLSAVSKDPAQHWKLKHINTKYHFIRDNIQDGKIKIKYINTVENLVDIFTKPIGREVLQCAQMGLGLMTQQHTAAQQSTALLLREAIEEIGLPKMHMEARTANKQPAYEMHNGCHGNDPGAMHKETTRSMLQQVHNQAIYSSVHRDHAKAYIYTNVAKHS